MSYIEEGFIENQPIPVTIEGTKTIVSQMENCICKIIKEDSKTGIGFFSKIPYKKNILSVLVTNYHILNEKEIKKDYY